MEPVELCSLRGHLNSVTSTELYHDEDGTSLISGDTNGWIIWWDINRRRPNSVWKGHDSNIVTIKCMDNGLLLTHSKDSDIKIWNISITKNYGRLMPDEKYNDAKFFNIEGDDKCDKLSLRSELLEKYPLPENVTIPVNSLNYCNVDYYRNHLITPATTDSNNFDIYQIFAPSKQSGQSLESKLNLKRIATNIDPWKLYKKRMEQFNMNDGIEFEIDNDNMLKRDKFGIMMKVLFVREDLFYIGYESGHLIGFHIDFANGSSDSKELPNTIKESATKSGISGLLGSNAHQVTFDRTILNKEPKIRIFYMNNSNSPNPVISLLHDKIGDKIICGTTGKLLSFHKIPQDISFLNDDNTCERVNLKHRGIQSVSTSKDLIAVGFWDGIIKGYDRQMNEIFRYHKKLPRIGILETNNGQDQLEQEKQVKLYSVKLISPSNKQSNSLNGYKTLIKERRNILKCNLLISSHSDGTIIVFKM